MRNWGDGDEGSGQATGGMKPNMSSGSNVPCRYFISGNAPAGAPDWALPGLTSVTVAPFVVVASNRGGGTRGNLFARGVVSPSPPSFALLAWEGGEGRGRRGGGKRGGAEGGEALWALAVLGLVFVEREMASNRSTRACALVLEGDVCSFVGVRVDAVGVGSEVGWSMESGMGFGRAEVEATNPACVGDGCDFATYPVPDRVCASVLRSDVALFSRATAWPLELVRSRILGGRGGSWGGNSESGVEKGTEREEAELSEGRERGKGGRGRADEVVVAMVRRRCPPGAIEGPPSLGISRPKPCLSVQRAAGPRSAGLSAPRTSPRCRLEPLPGRKNELVVLRERYTATRTRTLFAAAAAAPLYTCLPACSRSLLLPALRPNLTRRVAAADNGVDSKKKSKRSVPGTGTNNSRCLARRTKAALRSGFPSRVSHIRCSRGASLRPARYRTAWSVIATGLIGRGVGDGGASEVGEVVMTTALRLRAASDRAARPARILVWL